jgi:hypothetical protein
MYLVAACMPLHTLMHVHFTTFDLCSTNLIKLPRAVTADDPLQSPNLWHDGKILNSHRGGPYTRVEGAEQWEIAEGELAHVSAPRRLVAADGRHADLSPCTIDFVQFVSSRLKTISAIFYILCYIKRCVFYNELLNLICI